MASEEFEDFGQVDIVERILGNQPAVEATIKGALGKRNDWFVRALNFLAWSILKVSKIGQSKNREENDLHQAFVFLGTSIFNHYLYSARCMWFGETISGLLLLRNGFEDLLFLKYLHEKSPSLASEWLAGKVQIKPAEVRKAFQQDNQSYSNIYWYLCQWTHTNPEKISPIQLLVREKTGLPLGGHFLMPEATLANFDNLIDAVILADSWIQVWYRTKLPKLSHTYANIIEPLIPEFEAVSLNRGFDSYLAAQNLRKQVRTRKRKL